MIVPAALIATAADYIEMMLEDGDRALAEKGLYNSQHCAKLWSIQEFREQIERRRQELDKASK